jgi:hypothetical protein
MQSNEVGKIHRELGWVFEKYANLGSKLAPSNLGHFEWRLGNNTHRVGEIRQHQL